MRLIDAWHEHGFWILWRLWSLRMAIFWAGLNGAVLGLSAFVGIIDPWWFLALNTVGYALIAVARVTKQPGLE